MYVYWIVNLDDSVLDDQNESVSNVDRFVLSAMRLFYKIEPTEDIRGIEGSHTNKITPQYDFRRGTKLFRIKGWEATKKKLDKNLLGMNAVKIILHKDLNWKLQKEALSYLMFFKCKHIGVVKSKGCCDGGLGREPLKKG